MDSASLRYRDEDVFWLSEYDSPENEINPFLFFTISPASPKRAQAVWPHETNQNARPSYYFSVQSSAPLELMSEAGLRRGSTTPQSDISQISQSPPQPSSIKDTCSQNRQILSLSFLLRCVGLPILCVYWRY